MLAKASLHQARLAQLAEPAALLTPRDGVDLAELNRRRWIDPGEHGGEHTHGAAYDQAGAGDLVPADAPLLMAQRTEELLEVIVGARPSSHIIRCERGRGDSSE